MATPGWAGEGKGQSSTEEVKKVDYACTAKITPLGKWTPYFVLEVEDFPHHCD